MRQIQVIFIIFLCTMVRAEIINIPADFETIQEGIDASADGDTVVVAPGKYYETLFVNKGIVLASQYIFNPDTSIISQTIICGDSSSSNPTGLLSVTVPETQITISGFTFTHHDDDQIPDVTKIYISGFDSPGILFTDSKIINNVSDRPYIFSSDAPVRMKNVYFANNSLRLSNDYLRTPLIFCSNSVEMDNVKIINNTFLGINLAPMPELRAELINVTIKGNSGYGILAESVKSFFADNIKILNNGFAGIVMNNISDSVSITNSEIAYNNDGGINAYVEQAKYFYLEGTSIHDNRAPLGGGLNIYVPTYGLFQINDENRCSIYNNDATFGSDIYIIRAGSFTENMSIALDTFTVAEPSLFYACDKTYQGRGPIQIDFNHALRSTTASDLHVSPEGNDNNSGISPANPLKTISQALRIIDADSLHTRNIHLAEGIYSPSTNGERFPIYPRDYVSLTGAGSPDKIVLDAEKSEKVIYLSNIGTVFTDTTVIIDGRPVVRMMLLAKDQSIKIKNLTITGAGKSWYDDDHSSGGGIFCGRGVNARIERCNIVNNTWFYGGGIILDSATPIISNCTFYNNTTGFSANYLSDIHIETQTAFDTAFVINSMIHKLNDSYVTDGKGIRFINNSYGTDSLVIDAVNSNYHLPEGSPLIDAGLSYYEHEGNAIVAFKPWDYAGDAPDIGAMEYGFTYTDVEEKNNRVNAVGDFVLFQNYPNPFNATTTVSFRLPKPTNTIIKIYDLRGRLIDKITMNMLSAGSHKLNYNANALSSGIYFYEIQAGNNFVQTKKMILIK